MRLFAGNRSLIVTAAILAVAFVVAPSVLAGGGYGSFYDNQPLVDALDKSFAAYWRSGVRTSDLQDLVDYWMWYHVAKAAIAAGLLAVLAVLCLRSRRTWGRAVTAVLAVGATILTMANVQGAAAPFASLLPMLSDEARQAHSVVGDAHETALAVMVGDFARYHAVLAGLAALVAAVLIVVVAVCLRRRLPIGFTASTAALSALMLVVVAANVTNAVAPEEGLQVFLSGG